MFSIYCSGSIKKGPKDNGKLVWGDDEKRAVMSGADPIAIRFLNPDDPVARLDRPLALFGRDMFQIQLADFVIVDARERRGLGIGIEMLASRLVATPLIVVAPRDTYYRMDTLTYRGGTVSDYTHPHLFALADAIVDDFNQAGIWIKAHADERSAPKSVQALYEAIADYKDEILPTDRPMLDVLKELESVSKG